MMFKGEPLQQGLGTAAVWDKNDFSKIKSILPLFLYL